MKRGIMILAVLTVLLVLYSAGNVMSPEQKRERILNELSLAIEEAQSEGKYNCCIEPPCTMCYFGDWIWKDGSCDCGGMIARGELDKVCPQCKKGIEAGLCKSTAEQACNPDSGEIFKSIS